MVIRFSKDNIPEITNHKTLINEECEVRDAGFTNNQNQLFKKTQSYKTHINSVFE